MLLKPGRFNMLHTSLEVLAKQNKLRPKTQQSQKREAFPALRKPKKREPLKAVRTPFTNEVFNTWLEEEENRPETPFVKTRLQRQLLSSGGSRPNLPCETAEVFTPTGMYRRQMGLDSPTILLRSSGRASSKGRNRCGTPIPFDQPLTKLCWNAGIDEELSDLSDYETPVNFQQISTPRRRTASPLGKKKDYNDITVSDLECVDGFEPETVSLTQKILSHYFQKKVSSTQRIVKWLADCEEKSSGSTLPAHLPDIMFTSRPHIPSPHHSQK